MHIPCFSLPLFCVSSVNLLTSFLPSVLPLYPSSLLHLEHPFSKKKKIASQSFVSLHKAKFLHKLYRAFVIWLPLSSPSFVLLVLCSTYIQLAFLLCVPGLRTCCSSVLDSLSPTFFLWISCSQKLSNWFVSEYF